MADRPNAKKPLTPTTVAPLDAAPTAAPATSPRLPHERDESSDSLRSPPRESMKRAHDDLAAGLVDTDRGAAADAAYERQKTAPVPPAKPIPEPKT